MGAGHRHSGLDMLASLQLSAHGRTDTQAGRCGRYKITTLTASNMYRTDRISGRNGAEPPQAAPALQKSAWDSQHARYMGTNPSHTAAALPAAQAGRCGRYRSSA
ncbi:hypothetical protein COCOBI_02-6710 [Coccomyxa sp. Obi]|nr:hypothetical protein COCOBI_02-6710 [Coccomyxa sp. Obi]